MANSIIQGPGIIQLRAWQNATGFQTERTKEKEEDSSEFQLIRRVDNQ